MKKQKLGKKAEQLAVKWLKRKGYRIVEKNFRSRLGEIDIIAHQKNYICFIEVKARTHEKYGKAEEAIINRKKQKLKKVAQYYIFKNGISLDNYLLRFDVLTIDFSARLPKIELIKNAF